MNRRELLKLGAAGAAGAVLAKGADHAFTTAHAQPGKGDEIARAQVDLGKWVFLAPTKLGGGAYAMDLSSGRDLAWITYWPYGDTCPISHHVSAYPSADPYKGFEFINTTQGGQNVLIYGIPTRIQQLGLLEKTGEGNRIYRVRYDGQRMEVVEDVAETTGIGLGVHAMVYPDAKGFSCSDGQKDVAAFFDRAKDNDKTNVLAAFGFDWEPAAKELENAWKGGGTLTIRKLHPFKERHIYDLQGSKGNKIDWEMVPMGELLVETGNIPGASPRTLVGADATVHHPDGRWCAVVCRLLGGVVLIDRETYEPVTFLHTPEGAADHFPVHRVAKDAWTVRFPEIPCPSHEAGFSPDGRWFCMMNNLRQNNVAVFDSSDADPKKWKKVAYVKDPRWVGEFPSPFHLCFSVDGSKVFFSILSPSPAPSSLVVADTKTWKVVKTFEKVGPDLQTISVTYDGKYGIAPFSGFQRLSSGLFVFNAQTLEPVGYLSSPGGHHDGLIVPTKLEHLRNSRCTTL